MTGVRRMTLLAASLWVALHLTQAVHHADQHRSDVALAVALVLALGLSAFALAPLLSPRTPEALDPRVGGVVTAASVLLVLCVHPFLSASGLSGYANWPMGLSGVLVASLVLREGAGWAAATAVVVVTGNAVAVGAAPGVGWVRGLSLAVPPLTWLLGSLAIRAVLRRSAVLREAYVRRGFTFADEERLRRAVREADEVRRHELRSRVEPLLRRVAEQGADETLRAEARLAAEDLRDSLKARSLLTRSLRDQVGAARARGVTVVVSSAHDADEQAEPALIGATRTLLERVLVSAVPGTTVSCRTTVRPDATLLLVRAPDETETARAHTLLDEALHEIEEPSVAALLEEYDGELLLELRRR